MPCLFEKREECLALARPRQGDRYQTWINNGAWSWDEVKFRQARITRTARCSERRKLDIVNHNWQRVMGRAQAHGIMERIRRCGKGP